jgi:hypothetical protein
VIAATCPTCQSTDPKVCRIDCHNPWHRYHGRLVHLQIAPIGTPNEDCHAACHAPVDDPPSELAVDLAFVSCATCIAVGTWVCGHGRRHPSPPDGYSMACGCPPWQGPPCDREHPAPTCNDPTCYREDAARKADEILPGLGNLVRKGNLDPDPDPPARPKLAKVADVDVHWRDPAKVIRRYQELTDDQVAAASIDELRAAYRGLRDHHVAETTALIAGRDDLAKRCEDKLDKSQEILVHAQKLLASADTIMRRDEATIERLTAENNRLTDELRAHRTVEKDPR